MRFFTCYLLSKLFPIRILPPAHPTNRRPSRRAYVTTDNGRHYPVLRQEGFLRLAKRKKRFPSPKASKAEIRAIDYFRPERIDEIGNDWERANFVDSKNGIATFFAKKTTPPQFRSVPVVDVNGDHHMVPSIFDVVRWSHTKRGAKEYIDGSRFDKNRMLPIIEPEVPEPSICSVGGFCE